MFENSSCNLSENHSQGMVEGGARILLFMEGNVSLYQHNHLFILKAISSDLGDHVTSSDLGDHVTSFRLFHLVMTQ